MSKLSEIYKAYIEEMRSVLRLSELLLQKQKNSLNGELKTSGKICEDFVKDLLSPYIPDHLRLTSGYIINPEKKENDDNLPQFDLILADKRTPPIYKFRNLEIEVVPVESVCAIIEIKRSITNKNIHQFVDKLNRAILEYPELKKDIPYNEKQVNVANLSCAISSPLIGIISLTSEADIGNPLDQPGNILDFIWSVDGYSLLPVMDVHSNGENNRHLCTFLSRPRNCSFGEISEDEWKKYISNGKDYKVFHVIDKNAPHPEEVMKKVLGFLIYIFHRLSGRQGIDNSDLVNKYYLSP